MHNKGEAHVRGQVVARHVPVTTKMLRGTRKMFMIDLAAVRQ